MRQAQSNRRGRGRSRKAQNPLTKNYESNGPDVKIRGTAAHISEKYNSLARDAQTSGDIVRQENYFQHAEHYNRIIAAAQQNNQSNADKSDDQPSQGDDADQQNASSGKGRNDGRKNNNRRRRPDTRAQKSNGDASEAEATASQTDETGENKADKTDGKDTKPRARGRRRSEPKVEMIAPEQSEAPVADNPASETPIIENNADDAAA